MPLLDFLKAKLLIINNIADAYIHGGLEIVTYLQTLGFNFTAVARSCPHHWRVHRWAREHMPFLIDAYSPQISDEEIAIMLATAHESSKEGEKEEEEELLAVEYVIETFGLARLQRCISLLCSSQAVVPHRRTIEMLHLLDIVPEASDVLLYGSLDTVKFYFEQLEMLFPNPKEIGENWKHMPIENLFYWHQRKRELHVAAMS